MLLPGLNIPNNHNLRGRCARPAPASGLARYPFTKYTNFSPNFTLPQRTHACPIMAHNLQIKEITLCVRGSMPIPYKDIGGQPRGQKENPYNITQQLAMMTLFTLGCMPPQHGGKKGHAGLGTN